MVSSAESFNTIEYKNLLIICPHSDLIKWDKQFHKKNKIGSKDFKKKIHLIIVVIIKILYQ